MMARAPTHSYVSDAYVAAATLGGLNANDIVLIKKYAERIEQNGLPVIFDDDHLASILGFNKELLYSISNAPHKFYRTFYVPKKNGDLRKIREPLPTLKEIQRSLLCEVVEKIEISKAAKAFRHDSDIKKNARIHYRQKVILKFDLKDFFPSTKLNRVYQAFFGLGYTKQVSSLLASLCCCDGELPQGAPTSPALANVVFRDIDAQILGECLNNNLRYTRYADDIAISGEAITVEHIKKFRNVIKRSDYKFNEKKTNILRNGSRKVVTGVVVNEKMQAPRPTRRKFRQAVYYIKKYGIDGHLRQTGGLRNSYLDHLIGIGQHILWINKNDRSAREEVGFLKQLRASYKS